MFDKLEACGYFLRLDQKVRPSMFHGATISKAELSALKEIKNVIRLGRVTHLEENRIVLEEGEIPTTPNTVHVDCTASAIMNTEIKPVFDGKTITPQMVRSYQPIFSAAFIAHIELTKDTQEEKNRLCNVVVLPNHDVDFIEFTSTFMLNQYNWGQDTEIREWLRNNRLDGFAKMVSSVDASDKPKREILNRLRMASMPAGMKLQSYLKQLEQERAGE